MNVPKDAATLDPGVVESRAEALLAMDVLMRPSATSTHRQAGW